MPKIVRGGRSFPPKICAESDQPPFLAQRFRVSASTVIASEKSSIISERTTLRSLYAIGRPSVVCLSVCCLSVTLVHPTQAVELFGIFFSPYDSPGTLLFWCQKSLVGDAPFPLKFAFKVTHPL